MRLQTSPAKHRIFLLSYMDDINTLGLRTTGTSTWHKQLEEAAESGMLKWDKAKDWEGKDASHLNVYM